MRLISIDAFYLPSESGPTAHTRKAKVSSPNRLVRLSLAIRIFLLLFSAQKPHVNLKTH